MVTDPHSEPERPTIDWAFLAQWILATTLGWIVAWSTTGEIGVGLVVGFGQWLVLRQWFSGATWILMSAGGWAIAGLLVGYGLIPLPPPGFITSLILGAIFGAFMGFGQWLVLRRFVRNSAPWIAVSAASWAAGFSGVLGVVFAGALAGLITGILLDWLLRNDLMEVG